MAKRAPTRPDDDAELMVLVHAIVANDVNRVTRLLEVTRNLATRALIGGATRQAAVPHYLKAIEHYVYAGDTALHVAGAAYRRTIAELLIASGANVCARNRRGAEPLHYAADGGPTLRTWDPRAQAETIAYLIEAGAKSSSTDKSGVAPIHRAVRNRCTGAVRALLEGGADPRLKNRAGSTPMDLASLTTGKSGSGMPQAKEEQAEMVRLLRAKGSE